MTSQENKDVFVPMEGGQFAEEGGPTQIESLCMNCENPHGMTSMLLTRIPHFREVVVMSFECEKCGYKNSEIQFGGTYAEEGAKFTLKVFSAKTRKEKIHELFEKQQQHFYANSNNNSQNNQVSAEEDKEKTTIIKAAYDNPDTIKTTFTDLNRQIVKSDSASLFIPELNFEIPANTQKGILNTLEGIVRKAIDDINQLQHLRRIQDPETANKIDAFIANIERVVLNQEEDYTVILDDPAGNSNIENYYSPKQDPQLQVTHYKRTRQQNQDLGLGLESEIADDKEQYYREHPEEAPEVTVSSSSSQKKQKQAGTTILSQKDAESLANKASATTPQEVMIFPETCYNCHCQGEVRMVLTDVPYFKQVVLMAFVCEKCGYKSNEVRSGGAIPEKGKRITLKVTSPEDMSRDILKSETATVIIPEIELEITHGSLGGVFTTIEGLLEKLYSQFQFTNTFSLGDSSVGDQKSKLNEFLDRLKELATGSIPFTITVDDPVANSYIQNLYAPDPDPSLQVEEYERTFEENEDLGLNDMNTENYGFTPVDETKQ